MKTFLSRSIFINLLFVLEGAANLAVDLVMAATLGLGARSDILYAAWAIPQAVGRGMFQSLTNSFMGLYTDDENREVAYNQSISVILILAFPLAALLSVLTILWLPPTVPGFGQEEIAATVPLAALLSWLVAFLALSETFRAIFYREHREIIPSVARLVGALATILFVLFTAGRASLVWVVSGILLGSVLETMVSFIGLRWQLKLSYRFSWPERSHLREIGRTVGPPLFGQAIRILAGVIQIALASLLSPGSLTAVTYANRIVNTLERFLFRGFVIATIQLSTPKKEWNMSSQFRVLVLISIPITVVLFALTEPLVDTVFGRGRFTADDVVLLSNALQAYSLAIIGIALTRIPLGLAYAKKKSGIVLGYFVVVSVMLILAEILLLDLGFDVRAFGTAFTISMISAYAWLYFTILRPAGIGILASKDVLRLAGIGTISGVATSLVAAALQGFPSFIILALGTLTCLVTLTVTAGLFKLNEYQVAAEVVAKYRR